MAHLISYAIHRTYEKYLGGVSDLDHDAYVWRINGEVIQKFRHYSDHGETLDFIIADAKGDIIHASILHDDTDFFSTCFVEGDWIFLMNFDLLPVQGEFRPAKHKFKIQLNRETLCTRVFSKESSKFLDCVNLENVLKGEFNAGCCVDLIGNVVNVGNSHDRNSFHGMSKWRIIQFCIQNERGCRLMCPLTGCYAESFLGNIDLSESSFMVCVLRFTRITVQKGILMATTAGECTEVLLDPPLPEVAMFRNSLENVNAA